MFRPPLIAVLLAIGSFAAKAQDRQQAFAMNERMGRGINMGNMFEAPAEGDWGNPWQASYFRMIADLGFQHVRVPVRWETAERSMASSPYTISADFLERIQEVVDSALRHELHVIINMHHHEALFENPAVQRDRFLSQWGQIAEHFKDYSDSLIFEVLNEPHGNLSPALWNEYFAAALSQIRETNSDRTVLMGVAEYGGLSGVPELELPEDDNIILSVHYYNPFSFTHQGAEWVDGSSPWLGTEWLDTEADRESVISEFRYALEFAGTNNIPIHIGEFGAYSRADGESRERWTTFLARWFEEQNFSWAYWEFSAGFGIYDPGTKKYHEGLVDALLHHSMPDPTAVFSIPVYVSNFNTGVDGWSLAQQAGSSGGLSASSDKLVATIVNAGTEGWHLQLIRNNIPLVKGKLYRISFTGYADAARSAAFYVGKATSPWNAYSDYNGLSVSTQEATYAFTFTMSSPSDPAARIVFDLGGSAAKLHISDVRVEELVIGAMPVSLEIKEASPHFYPNPVSRWIRIHDADQYHTADILDLSGKLVQRVRTNETDGIIYVGDMPAGIYVLRLIGKKAIATLKLTKQ